MDVDITEESPDLKSKYIAFDRTRIHYFEQGEGDPVIFLHGAPTSAWVWRKVIPFVAPLSRCIAPDLAGFGKSGEPDQIYSIRDQLRLLETLIETLQLDRVTFVLHGLGGVLGLTWAMQNEAKCRGLVFYETWLRPVVGDHLSLPWQQMVTFAAEAAKNAVPGLQAVDHMLRSMALLRFDEATLAHYCAPFSHTGAGKPLAALLAEVPDGSGKSTVDVLLTSIAAALEKSRLPKLLMYSVPGFLTTIATIEWARKTLSTLEVVEVGEALHFAPELQPERMGKIISAWLQSVDHPGNRSVTQS